jgi:hypothetical protein
MDESSVYNESDLAPFRRRLNDLRTIIKSDSESGKHPDAMTKLLERQLWDSGVFPISSRPPLLASHHALESVLNRMQDNLAVICDELLPLHERLVTIRRKLVGLAAKGGLVKAELKPLQEELRKIDSLSTSRFRLKAWSAHALFLPLSQTSYPLTPFTSHTKTCRKRVDGKFLGPGGSIPASQAICSSLLEECFDIIQEIRAQEESKHVAPPLKPIYDRLTGIRAELEGLALTHRWTLRETDLWNYSLSLQEVDKMRIDGKFVDSEGAQPSGQYVRLMLTRLDTIGY